MQNFIRKSNIIACDKSKYCEIIDIQKYIQVKCLETNEIYEIYNYIAIALTDDLLIKSGFIKKRNSYSIKLSNDIEDLRELIIFIDHNNQSIYLKESEDLICIHSGCLSYHFIQNLYMILTGFELSTPI